MSVKTAKMEVMLSTIRSKTMLTLFLGTIAFIFLVIFALFMPMPGLYGGDEFISDMALMAAGLFGGLAMIGYFED